MKSSPEQNINFLNQITFWWVNSLIYKGYKNTLEKDDLFELLESDKSTSTTKTFEEIVNNKVSKKK